MIEQTNLIDEVDCASFFDHIDDILDWPTDDIPDSATTFPCFWSPSDSLPGCDSVLDNHIENNSSDLSPELSVPFEDVVQLEWLSNFVEDSFSGRGLTMNKEVCNSTSQESSPHQFETSSPLSVLESSSSCSSEKTASCSPETGALGRRGRARTKRPRPVTFTPCAAVQIALPTSSVTDTPNQQSIVASKVASDSENYAKSRLLIRLPKQVSGEHKKKKIKFSVPLGSAELNENSSPPPNQQQAVRKCIHCEITKTPQWRAGPIGPKTLCNACGVRHKSGRLFPEYRPAASPTFVPSLHSNSHRKVLEMRNKRGSKLADPEPATMVTNSPKFIRNRCNLATGYISTNEMRNQRSTP